MWTITPRAHMFACPTRSEPHAVTYCPSHEQSVEWLRWTDHRSAVKEDRERLSRKPASKQTRPKPKAVLRLPDLDQAKSAVLNSLTSADAQRGYRHAIEEFVEWYCSEPRLSFSRTVVLRYRIHLESRNLAPGTINLRLGAVRPVAYEAADCGLLSPDLAAGIRRVKGRYENWREARKLAHR